LKSKLGSICLGLAVAGALSVGVSSMASASHYRLPVDGLVTVDETEALKKAGIATTLDLLDAIAPKAGRESVASKSGLTFARLTTLAAQVDLLRVNGLGPSMVRLLQAGGVRHARDLAKAAPAELRARLEAANGVHRIAPVLGGHPRGLDPTGQRPEAYRRRPPVIRWFAGERWRLAAAAALLLGVLLGVGPVATAWIWDESSSHLANLLILLGLAFALLGFGGAVATLVGDVVFPNRWRERVILGRRVAGPADDALDSPDTVRGMKTYMLPFSALFVVAIAGAGFGFDAASGGFLKQYQRFGSLRTTLRSDDTAGKLESLSALAGERRENRLMPILELLDLTWRDPRQPDEVRSAALAAMGKLVAYLSDAIDSWMAEGRQDSWQQSRFAELRETLAPQLREARERAEPARAVELTHLLGLLRDLGSEPALIAHVTDRTAAGTPGWRAAVIALGRMRTFAAFEAVVPLATWTELDDEAWFAVAFAMQALAREYHRNRPDLEESRIPEREQEALSKAVSIWAPLLSEGADTHRCVATMVALYLRDARMRDPIIAAFDAPAGADMLCPSVPVDVGLGRREYVAEQGFFRRRLIDALALIALGDPEVKAFVDRRIARGADLEPTVKALLEDLRRHL
jgi:predicted flap endonuclease-1-like 5' DNA nuclease